MVNASSTRVCEKMVSIYLLEVRQAALEGLKKNFLPVGVALKLHVFACGTSGLETA